MGASKAAPVDRLALIALLLTGAAAYGLCLLFIPNDSDELTLLSSFAHAPHPFGYFAGDWGLGNHLYRPLYSLIHWLQFQAFGVWALPDQLLSLALHLAVIAIVFELIVHAGRHLSPALRLLLAMVALISPYTMTGASWTANQSSVMAALCLVLVVRHLCLATSPPSVWYVVVLSIAAVLSRESGMVVPAFAVIYGWMNGQQRLLRAGVFVIAGYVVVRFAVFGAAAATYPESGFLLGTWGYADSSALTLRQFAITLIENPLKHVLAIALPIFTDEGALRNGGLRSDPEFWLATAGLVAIAGRPRSRAQWLALSVILLNAVIHYAVFRFRTLYIPQLAMVVYVAASPALITPWRQRVALAMAAIVLVSSVLSVERGVAEELAETLQGVATSPDVDGTRIDPKIIDAVNRVYFP